MTARKHFKRLVRERMLATGERYSVARAHVAAAPDPWEHRGGADDDAGPLAAVLANLGVVAPHTGEPLTEAVVLGVGGGLGAGYILWEFEHQEHREAPILTLGFRNQWQYPGPWVAAVTERLGLHAEIVETGSRRAAAAQLEDALARGLPAIVAVDHFRLGHRHLPASLDGRGGAPVIVHGRAGEALLVDDGSRARLTVTAERLADARARVGSYKHRSIVVDPARVEVDLDGLRAAAAAGLEEHVANLSRSSSSFALPAWRKWQRMLTDERNAKAWPKVFAGGYGLASAVASIHEEVADGRHLRGLYADFLAEAGELLERDLAAPAEAYRAAARAWEALLDAVLPPGDPLRLAIERAGSAEAAAERWRLQGELDATMTLAEVVARLEPALAAVNEAEREALGALRERRDSNPRPPA